MRPRATQAYHRFRFEHLEPVIHALAGCDGEVHLRLAQSVRSLPQDVEVEYHDIGRGSGSQGCRVLMQVACAGSECPENVRHADPLVGVERIGAVSRAKPGRTGQSR